MTVNKWIGIGNLGQDPHLQHTGSGTAVCTLSIACNERRKDPQSGEWTQHTEWVRVVCWGRTAESAAQYLRKGRQVYVEGRLQTRAYTDRDGQERKATEVVAQTLQFLQGGSDRGHDDAPQRRPSAPPASDRFDDDPIPF